jgi:hypothetical protein
MTPNAQRLLDEARQLLPEERQWIAECLLIQSNEEAFAALEKEYGDPEPAYDEWARAHIEEALADTSPSIPHEQVMKEIDGIIRAAKEKKLKETARTLSGVAMQGAI